MRRLYNLAAILLIGACLVFSGCGDSKDKKSVSVPVSVTEAIKTPTPTSTPMGTPTPSPTATPTPLPDNYLPVIEKAEVPDTSSVLERRNSDTAAFNKVVKNAKERGDQPAICVTLSYGVKVSSKDEYVPCVVDVLNCEEQFQLTATAGIKVRGNSTASGGVKPYRIKFEEKQSMLGLHDGEAYKSWVLMKPYWNLSPDLIGFTTYRTISEGKYYSSDAELVHLYVGGQYCGLYLLCEQNQNAKGRVEIKDLKEDEQSTEVGYFLEIDNYPGEDHHHFTIDYGKRDIEDFLGETRKANVDEFSVKNDINTKEQLERIAKHIANVYEVCYYACIENKAMVITDKHELAEAKDLTPEEAVEKVIDLDSVIYMYLTEELMQNYDVGAGSFYMAVDFGAESQYEKLTFLAPWDFNWAGYEPANRNFYAGTWQKLMDKVDRSHMWFITLMRADWFKARVKAQVDHLYDDKIIENMLTELDARFDSVMDDVGGEKDKVHSAKKYCNYVRNRLKYLKENL